MQANRSLRAAPDAAGPAGAGELRMAAIDVGSNSLHMVIAQVASDGAITTLWRMKEMVGLGRISFPSRRLTNEAMDRALSTLRRFKEAAERRQCDRIITAATSAVREADNRDVFLQRARAELGMTVRVLSARDEARMIYLGVRNAIKLKNEPTFILDIGGGSVEFIVADKKSPQLLESLKLGASRMTAKFVKTDPIAPTELKSLLAHYEQELTPLCERIRTLRPVEAIGTSGTIENLSAMCAALYGTTPGVIEAAAMGKLVGRLLETRSDDRSAFKGLDGDRKDQILAGALLLNELMRRLALPQVRLCDSAMREGILLDHLARRVPTAPTEPSPSPPRRRSVLGLAQRCEWHQSHSEQVARLTLELFDQLKPLHRLDKRARELIEYAALLHDIGWHIGKSGHHKHSMYLILHGELKGFSEEEIQIMANIARYHRKGKIKSSHDKFTSLSSQSKNIVRIGASLLRIADGLDRSHCGVVTAIATSNRNGKVVIRLRTRGPAEMEIWGARRKMTLFIETFGRELDIRANDR